MGTNLAEGMMHAAVARSKRFTLISFTDTDLNLPSDRQIYLRHRENFLPLSYDGQQDAEAGAAEQDLEPGKWIPEHTAKYHLHEYDFLQQPFLIRL